MRIGVLGGSFNPPHQGHLDISLTAIKRLRLNGVWWLVSPGNPLKDKPLSLSLRVYQCEEITEPHPAIKVTGFESCAYAKAPYYSIHTIDWLKRRFSQTRFVWIMGADNLVGFHHWYRWEEIFHTMPVVVMDRPGDRLRAMRSQASVKMALYRKHEQCAWLLPGANLPAWSFLTLPLNPVSSTQIRARQILKSR